MPSQSPNELREQIEAIFKNPHCESCHEDWDYDSSYRTDSCCTRFMTDSISKVVQLITSYTDEKVREARIAGLKDSIDIWNTSDSDEVFYGQIEQRIAQLNESEKK